MPPKNKKTDKAPKVKRFQSFIDPSKYAEQMKQIQSQKIEAEEDTDIAEEEDWDYDEMDFEGEDDEFSLSENENAYEVGRIDISFPENVEEYENSPLCYPPSYYTLSPKERLLLLYCENFRKQFVLTNERHRPLVLALPNECNVQVGTYLIYIYSAGFY